MSGMSRRKLITAGLATVAGASGLAVAAKLAARYGLIPPDAGGLCGAGETLTYAAQRILNRHALAREFAPARSRNTPSLTPLTAWGISSSAFSRERLRTGAWPSMGWSRALPCSLWRS